MFVLPAGKMTQNALNGLKGEKKKSKTFDNFAMLRVAEGL